MVDSLEIPAIFDAHMHLRQGNLMRDVVQWMDRVCDDAIIMPNVVPPIDSAERLKEYRQELLQTDLSQCRPHFTFKITPALAVDPSPLQALKDAGAIAGKLYPDGVTTNSHGGITVAELSKARPLDALLEEMERLDLVLSIHAEMPGQFCLDREKAFCSVIQSFYEQHPQLRIVVEHITNEATVFLLALYSGDRIAGQPPRLAATITAHHLFLTLDSVVGDTLRPHLFCKPIAKREADRAALVQAATSGSPCFFFGSDSAPHLITQKECASGCAGVFSAPVMVEKLAECFDAEGKLDRLEDFTSTFGRAFYRLPAARTRLRLQRKPKRVLNSAMDVVPWCAGETLIWTAQRV
jgi:dihydroorotase